MSEYNVPPAIFKAATYMDLPPTAHTLDIDEEAQLAQVSFSLASLGVEPPILLSQYPATYTPEQLL